MVIGLYLKVQVADGCYQYKLCIGWICIWLDKIQGICTMLFLFVQCVTSIGIIITQEVLVLVNTSHAPCTVELIEVNVVCIV